MTWVPAVSTVFNECVGAGLSQLHTHKQDPSAAAEARELSRSRPSAAGFLLTLCTRGCFGPTTARDAGTVTIAPAVQMRRLSHGG